MWQEVGGSDIWRREGEMESRPPLRMGLIYHVTLLEGLTAA